MWHLTKTFNFDISLLSSTTIWPVEQFSVSHTCIFFSWNQIVSLSSISHNIYSYKMFSQCDLFCAAKYCDWVFPHSSQLKCFSCEWNILCLLNPKFGDIGLSTLKTLTQCIWLIANDMYQFNRLCHGRFINWHVITKLAFMYSRSMPLSISSKFALACTYVAEELNDVMDKTSVHPQTTLLCKSSITLITLKCNSQMCSVNVIIQIFIECDL